MIVPVIESPYHLNSHLYLREDLFLGERMEYKRLKDLIEREEAKEKKNKCGCFTVLLLKMKVKPFFQKIEEKLTSKKRVGRYG